MKKQRSVGNDVGEVREERMAREPTSTMVGREVGTMEVKQEVHTMEAKQELRPQTDPRPGPAPGTRRIWCSECDKYCTGGPSHLQQHQDAVHLHLRPWECDHCGDKFSKKSSLEQHITTVHLGLRLYPCPVEGCGKSFTDGKTVRDHGRAKHGHPLLCCIVCGATFAWTCYFKKHRRTHKEV